MAKTDTNLYEGLFLFSPAAVNSNASTAAEQLREVFERAEAEVLSIYKWADQRLAFEVQGNKRGLYLLSYFKTRGSRIANIERDVNLSETMLRCMILRADHIGEIELNNAKEKEAVTLGGESGESASSESAGEGEAPAEAPGEAAPAAETETATATATEPQAGESAETPEGEAPAEQTPAAEAQASSETEEPKSEQS